MTDRHIHTRYRTVSASLLRETIGKSLSRIKDEDHATFADLGVVLGKSGDRAEAYAKGEGEMGSIAFLRACERWDGRFANEVLALVGMTMVPRETSAATDRDAMPAITGLLHQVALALADDGKIDDRELDEMGAAIDAAKRALDMLHERRRRLRLVA